MDRAGVEAVERMRGPIGEIGARVYVPSVERAFDVVVAVPGSKSLTNRAILVASLAVGESVLSGALVDADDAQRMIEAVRTLGAGVEVDTHGTLRIEGVGGVWDTGELDEVRLDVGNAGTAARFLTAAALLADPATRNGVVIDGNERMRQRPIGELVEMLRALGAEVEYVGLESEGKGNQRGVPIRVLPCDRFGELNNELWVGATASSQFVSALLLVGPFLPDGLTIHFEGAITSESYVRMTVGLLARLGVNVVGDVREGWVRVFCSTMDLGNGEDAECMLEAFEYEVEPDASGATYFWAAAALVEGARCVVPRLDGGSLQEDARFARVLGEMGADVEVDQDGTGSTAVRGAGVLRGVRVDMARMPDAAMTLAVVCCFADGVSEIWGLWTLRHKETDRLAALKAELEKIGARVELLRDEASGDEGLRIDPAGVRDAWERPVIFETYDDHRMAMAMALVGLVRPGVTIDDPACVCKTYTRFWQDLARVYRTG